MSAVFGISKGRDVEPEIELLNSARLHDAEGWVWETGYCHATQASA